MSFTNQDILNKINKQINYEELAQSLQSDLNIITEQVITNIEDFLEFKVFFDAGEFDSAVELLAPGEGVGTQLTPVLLSLVSGEYSDHKNPEIFNLQFRIEAMGFMEHKKELRSVLEVFSSLNQGAILTDFFGAQAVSTTDFPVLTEPFQLKGFERVSAFMSWGITFVFEGELTAGMGFELNSVPIDVRGFMVKRSKTGKPIQKVGSPEQTKKYDSQLMVLSGGVIYKQDAGLDNLLKAIVEKDYGLQTTYSFKVRYNDSLSYTYNVYLDDGELIAIDGGYVHLNFVFLLV